MPHDTQTNDFLAAAGMDAYFGRDASWKAPMPWTLGGSENHKMEGAVLGLIQSPGSEEARKEVVRRLDQQALTGHQGKEFGTPSHAPHWYRAMSLALWWCQGRGIARDERNQEAIQAIRRWWAHDAWVRDQYRVPRGPRAGQVIGWGARFEGEGRNEVRDVVDTLVRKVGRDDFNAPVVAGVFKGEKFYDNARQFKDTFPCLVVRDLARNGAFSGIEPERSAIAFVIEIERRDGGHTVRCENPPAGDPREVRVSYDGKVEVVS